MNKTKLTMQCSCGNDKAWLVTAKAGPDEYGKYNRNRYFICCGNCDAEIELGLGLGQ